MCLGKGKRSSFETEYNIPNSNPENLQILKIMVQTKIHNKRRRYIWQTKIISNL